MSFSKLPRDAILYTMTRRRALIMSPIIVTNRSAHHGYECQVECFRRLSRVSLPPRAITNEFASKYYRKPNFLTDDEDDMGYKVYPRRHSSEHRHETTIAS